MEFSPWSTGDVTREIRINLVSQPETLRIKQHDILSVTTPQKRILLIDACLQLALLFSGPASVLDRLADRLGGPKSGDDPAPEPVQEKRQYCVDMAELERQKPEWDFNKIYDPTVPYQPFFLVDEETGSYLAAEQPPLRIDGLILDKYTGSHLYE